MSQVQVTKKVVAQHRKKMDGLVVSDRMQKTIVVKVSERVRHPLYGKYVTRVARYQAHDETHQARPGDWVRVVESRPLSRHKRWALQAILRKAPLSLEERAV